MSDRELPNTTSLTLVEEGEHADVVDKWHVAGLLTYPVTPYTPFREKYIPANDRAFLALCTLAEIDAAREIASNNMTPAPQPRVSKTFRECVEKIFREFTFGLPEGECRSSLPATHLTDLLKPDYGGVTIDHAKQALGIESFHPKKANARSYEIGKRGRLAWRWRAPKFKVKQALERVEPRNKYIPKDALDDPTVARWIALDRIAAARRSRVARILCDFMCDREWDVPAALVREEIKCSNVVLTRAKNALGIFSYREEKSGPWRWAFPCPDVADFVLMQFADDQAIMPSQMFARMRMPKRLIQLSALSLIQTFRMRWHRGGWALRDQSKENMPPLTPGGRLA